MANLMFGKQKQVVVTVTESKTFLITVAKIFEIPQHIPIGNFQSFPQPVIEKYYTANTLDEAMELVKFHVEEILKV